jgi:hypothetical protein
MQPLLGGCVGWWKRKATHFRKFTRRKNFRENDMIKTVKEPTAKGGGDLVLQEIWRVKDELSAARGHDVHRLFADARKRQKLSGHPVVNLQTKRGKV